MEDFSSQRDIQDGGDSDSSCLVDERENLLPGVTILSNRSSSAPPDRFKAVYLIFYLLGVGTLLPWNMFITAKDYFSYQLRNTTAPESTYKDNDTPLQLSYESAVALGNMIPNVVLQLLNTSLAGRISMRKRLIGSIVLMIVVFLITLIFTLLDVSEWQTAFYGITITCVIFSSSASALFSSSLFGLVATFPAEYTQSIMGGMGLGGVFASVAEIVTISLGGSVKSAAFWYFLLAIIVLVAALVSYLLLYKLEFAKYHETKYQKVLLENNAASRKSVVSEYISILKMIWKYAISVFLVFFVTLALFPATTSNVQSMHKNNGSAWTGKYFLPLYCFLLFNVGDLIGRTIAAWLKMPKPGVTIPLLSTLRIVFIPLFALCNVHPRSAGLPVVFDSDVYPIIFMVIFAVTNGYLSTQALMISPSLVSQQKTEMAGSLMSLWMTIGLGLGSAFSYAMVIGIKSI